MRRVPLQTPTRKLCKRANENQFSRIVLNHFHVIILNVRNFSILLLYIQSNRISISWIFCIFSQRFLVTKFLKIDSTFYSLKLSRFLLNFRFQVNLSISVLFSPFTPPPKRGVFWKICLVAILKVLEGRSPKSFSAPKYSKNLLVALQHFCLSTTINLFLR